MRIVVVRALYLGDMLCAIPALRALRAAFPRAEITLVGLPWARELASRLTRLVDEFEEFPGFPGIPEQTLDPSRILGFLTRMQSRQFDLAVQLHGSGSHINEFVMLLGAARVAAFCLPGDATAGDGCFIPWPANGSEAERLLTLPLAMGCPDTGTRLELEANAADRAIARMLLAATGAADRPFVCVHPGARFPSRRWPAERFAAVADALSVTHSIVLTGTDAELPLTTAVRNAMHVTVTDLTGRLHLGTLAATVAGADLVVCNDTGVSHVAAAVGTKSVVIASGSDVSRWRPHDAERHRVLWHDVPCRPCMHEICPIGHDCAKGVSVDRVLAEAASLISHEVSHA